MERYLAETGPNAAHRAEVEATVETLRGRVGKLLLNVDAAGCDVLVDEQAVGTTPIDTAIVVSVGTRKVAVSCATRPGLVKHVEVAAGELVRLDLRLPPPPVAAVRGLGSATPTGEKHSLTTRSAVFTGWGFTALFLAGTIGVGTAALVEAGRLNALKQAYPVPPDQLNRQSQLTTGLAVSSDVLGIATLVAAGVSTYLTVKYDREKKLRIGVAGRGVTVSANF
jgi:hypothetical protein